MTDINTTSEPSVRRKQLDERRERMRKLLPKIERVRVVPANDDIRKYIAHPSGTKFPEQGSVEWPLDSFTRRRLRDGSVTREEQKREEHQPQTHSRRRHDTQHDTQ